MLCFEVWVNEERLCTAGAEESGRLMAQFNWDYHPDDTDERQEKEFGERTNNPGLQVYGISGREPHHHFSWLNRGVNPGDLVIFKFIEADSFDPPVTQDYGSYDVSDAPTPEEIGAMMAGWETDLNLQDNPRYCLQVDVNQKHLCTAGLRDFGNLGVHFSWHNVTKHPRSWNSTPTLSVRGHLEKEPFQYLKWSELSLECGDEINFQLIDSCDFDQPEVVRLVTPDTEDKGIIQQHGAIIEAKEKYRDNLN